MGKCRLSKGKLNSNVGIYLLLVSNMIHKMKFLQGFNTTKIVNRQPTSLHLRLNETVMGLEVKSHFC